MACLKKLWLELISTLKDRDIILLLIGAPIFLTLLFGGVYMNSYVEDIPVAVLDEDNSTMSRMLIQQFEENERFYVKYTLNSRTELEEALASGDVQMGLYIPIDFYKNITTLKGTEVLVLVDGSNVIIGNNAYAAAASIVQTIGAGVQMKVMAGKGALPQTAQNMALAFQFTDRTLYDPRMTYMNYLLLGFVAVFAQQVILSGLGISVLKDKEKLTQENTVLGILMKILICGVLSMASTLGAIGIAAKIFHVPIRGDLTLALLLCGAFVLSISGPTILLATAAGDKVKLAQLSFMLSLPSFVSCGYVWPPDQMPEVLVKIIKALWPLIYFARPFDEVLFKGLSFEAVRPQLISMAIFTAAWLPLSILAFRRKYRAV